MHIDMAPAAAARFMIDISNSKEITEFVINKGNGVKGLAETGLEILPPQYIQPPSERTGSINKADPKESIPIIDLSKIRDVVDPEDQVARSICHAAEKWGFFQVINHGVPKEVLENVKEATHRFFGLPAEEKRKYFKDQSPSNNVRLQTSFVPQAETALEWKDYFSLFYVSDEEVFSLWPPSCRDEVLEYMNKCETLINPLVEILMAGLDIKQPDKNLYSLLTGSKRVNLNYYPKCPTPELTVGVGRHSDVSTFTILLQDTVGGLYVRAPDGESWIHVPPVDGALVINVGDVLQILSNGRYKSIEHRVVANGTTDRISVPLFINPKPKDVIGPLEQVLMNTGEKPKYKRTVYSDYVKHFYRKAHDGKATLNFVKL